MILSLSIMDGVEITAPTGGVSPLAWVIIGALVVALLAVCTFSKFWVNRLYEDLKECRARRVAEDDETVGLLKVLSSQLERSKGQGGRK